MQVEIQTVKTRLRLLLEERSDPGLTVCQDLSVLKHSKITVNSYRQITEVLPYKQERK